MANLGPNATASAPLTIFFTVEERERQSSPN